MAARASVALRRNALLVFALVSIQATLGLCALAFSLPLAIVLAHSTVAAERTRARTGNVAWIDTRRENQQRVATWRHAGTGRQYPSSIAAAARVVRR